MHVHGAVGDAIKLLNCNCLLGTEMLYKKEKNILQETSIITQRNVRDALLHSRFESAG